MQEEPDLSSGISVCPALLPLVPAGFERGQESTPGKLGEKERDCFEPTRVEQ